MERSEAKSAIKALYLQSAALAGLEVSPNSPELLIQIVDAGFDKVEVNRRPTAVANTLRLIAVSLEIAEARGDKMLHEDNVTGAQAKVCPVYPFGK
jgi:hypothetical protein